MTVYIDTNTFAANPALYADAEKKKPLPRVIPSVLLNEGIVRIGFLGDYAPSAGVETVCAVASIPAPGNPLRVVTSYGTQVGNLWEVPINFDATEIADALVNRGSVNLSMGIIVEGADVRREYQFWVQCFGSAQGEISPEETADAKTFADAAKLSADNAAQSATDSAESATASAQGASASAQSASNADTSANNAAQSATNAKSSADKAETMAIAATSSVTAAKNHATAAANSASAAAQSASDASNSASSANTSAVSASNSATAAATSANNAAQSASAAKTSETNAKASETAAKASETASANSATSASTSATNAANSASSASTSATNAGNSAVAAAESAAQAAASAAQAEETLQNVYTKPQLDGVDTGAEVTLKMNEIIAQLKDWEEVTGETLPNEFWEALMAEFQRWQENPTEIKEWVTTSATESTNPYFAEAPTKPVIDFNVVKAKGYSGTGVFHASFNAECRNTIYLPAATDASLLLASNQKADCDVILPNATTLYRVAQNAQYFAGTIFAPLATNWNNALQGAVRFNSPVQSGNGTSFYMAFYSARVYDQVTPMNSANSAAGAFYQTAMSPANIAATLDTLPEKTDGVSRPIKFSRYDGTRLAPLMAVSPYAESVDAARAKGWTVQFDE